MLKFHLAGNEESGVSGKEFCSILLGLCLRSQCFKVVGESLDSIVFPPLFPM
jgi:hypothetical protein